ncbi:YigZ family protein, partial [Thermococcus sp.]
EPRGSAGKPVFKVLEYKGLENVVVVVTRYFGGTKLGYGGLIKAYSETASEALEKAGIIEIIKKELVEIVFPYNLYNAIEKTVEKFEAEILERDFSIEISFVVGILPEQKDEFVKYVNEITKGRAKIREFLDWERKIGKKRD